ncbi:MAG: ABC transporter permease [Senegalimassilia sp.]|uniref:ABC transporter permease n=1 Tax=Senegalimassilia sp. TaxID=1922200 RepID=UPI0028505AAF|nr:ABC transporter permease [Senegalimassilia sp.]MDR4054741.1 ABC transporter permease [Senegalimassilia sp.]
MASPLRKRFPRELKNNLGKYLGIFLLMSVTIALTSGFLLAAHSIGVIIDDMPEKYSIEDARFTTAFEATDEQLDAAADAASDAGTGDTDIVRNWSFDADFNHAQGDDGRDRTLRVYQHRTQVDLAAYADGRVPEAADEVAIDRVFATNNDISVGEEVELFGQRFTVCGIMTTSDNQALFKDNSDFTVNTLTFGVAEVSESGFAALEATGHQPTHTYSVRFADRDLTVAQRTDAEKDMMRALSTAGATVDDLTDSSANQGIGYAADDVSGDSTMWSVLLYMIIVIMAFVFVVLTSGTIEEESAVIGTLLASGYRRRELVTHYLALPAAVGIAAAVVGNVAGYTLMSEPMRNLYYGSYSLPPYYATWSWGVFAQTTVLPVATLVGITLLGLLHKMGHTPLEFLRHETSKGGVKRGFALPERLSFIARFRMRVFLRNLGNFATLFVGIGFASMLLLFSLAILPTMTHYAENLHNNVVAEHMYTLKAPLEVDNAQAEKYAVYSLEYDRGEGSGTETITVYGVPEDSRYWDDLAVGGGHVVFGNGLIDKFRFADGQTVNLYDKYEDETREATYEGDGCTWGTKSDMAVYMSLDDFNRFFGNDAGYFNGYASDQALDLDARYLTNDLTPESMDAIGEQFVGMMDDMIGMLVGLSVFIFLVFMYLLTKSVIDRSARAISYMKVFGYRDSEISRLYVRSITLTVTVSLVVCQPLIIGGLTLLFRAMLLAYNGNIEIYVPMAAIAEVIAIGFATYLAVALLHIRRIKRVPLALALKVQE